MRPPFRTWSLAGAFVVLFVLGLASHPQPVGGKPVRLTADSVEAGVLRFSVRDEEGAAIPARLTFVRDTEDEPELFTVTDAAPEALAVRQNVIYTLHGQGAITVPTGRYRVFASRGIEWSLFEGELEIAPGSAARFDAVLRREIDTRDWVSGDFHLHTLTHSGHGDASMLERVITLAGEEVEFAVATDHNHNTDYRPEMRTTGAGKYFSTVTGNEVTTDIGHFNAFPLDPARPIVDVTPAQARKLFKLIRAETNAFGVPPVIQVNHPRYEGLDYFGFAGLDPVSGGDTNPVWSDDFDTLEVLNDNEGGGYFDPDESLVANLSSRHSVLRDWFHLLDRGARCAAVGNSDSHYVHAPKVGYPRNYVRVDDRDPSKIDPAELAQALREKQVFTTLGPFVEFSVDGEPMGGTTGARGRAFVDVRVQAASWIDVDRVLVIVGGDEAARVAVPAARTSERFREQIAVELPDHDTWIVVLVEGDDPLPLVKNGEHLAYPMAVTNPVWIEVDGDARWTSPWEHALTLATDPGPKAYSRAFSMGPPADRAALLLAGAEKKHAHLATLVRRGLVDPDRFVRLAAARAAERLATPNLSAALERASREGRGDRYLSIAILRARLACGEGLAPLLDECIESQGLAALRSHASEIDRHVSLPFVRDWLLAGPFDSPKAGTLLERMFGPEDDPDSARSFDGKAGAKVAWHRAESQADGYLDLRALGGKDKGASDKTIWFAQTWLRAPLDQSAWIALGTDDGGRAWVDGRQVYASAAEKGADPWEHVERVSLRQGWNRVLVGVENGGGATGLYFRVLDPAITSAAKRE